jgi:hypothetical protein
MAQLGVMGLSTALALLAGAGFCYAAWLTSIVFCAAHGARPLLVAAAAFFPVGIVHGVVRWMVTRLLKCLLRVPSGHQPADAATA